MADPRHPVHPRGRGRLGTLGVIALLLAGILTGLVLATRVLWRASLHDAPARVELEPIGTSQPGKREAEERRCGTCRKTEPGHAMEVADRDDWWFQVTGQERDAAPPLSRAEEPHFTFPSEFKVVVIRGPPVRKFHLGIARRSDSWVISQGDDGARPAATGGSGEQEVLEALAGLSRLAQGLPPDGKWSFRGSRDGAGIYQTLPEGECLEQIAISVTHGRLNRLQWMKARPEAGTRVIVFPIYPD